MNYIVLDLEWNQALCPGLTGDKDLPFEIIEIGAVKLDSSFNKISEFCQVVKPKLYKELHFKIKEITHIDAATLASGKSFPEVFPEFLKWCGNDYMICTWGSLDVTELQRNMKYYNFPLFKKPVFFYDIQKIFGIVYDDRKVTRSLEWAVDFLGIGKDTPFHRALSDAYYTAKVMEKIDPLDIQKNFSIDCFQKPRNRYEQINVVYDTYSKFISREFSDKINIMKDNDVNSTRCYKCGKKAKRKIRWFSDNAKTYYSLSVCEEHGYLKGKIRLRKSEDDKVYAIKTLKLTDHDGASAIRTRQYNIRQKRREKRHEKRADK